MSRRRGFTLVELLVVIGIIALLISILLPAVSALVERGNATLCASHIRTLTQAFIAFARDNHDQLPGSASVFYSNPTGSDGTNTGLTPRADWLYGNFSKYNLYSSGTAGQNTPFGEYERLLMAPEYGTIWPYIARGQSNILKPVPTSAGATSAPPTNDDLIARKTYLCPSLTVSKPGSGVGSNGRFDYAAFGCFSGARISQIPGTCRLYYPQALITALPYNKQTQMTNAAGQSFPAASLPIPSSSQQDDNYNNEIKYLLSTRYDVYATPIICQEDPAYTINLSLVQTTNGGGTGSGGTNDWTQMDGEHMWIDAMAHCHNYGSYYGAIDGSVPWVMEQDIVTNLTGGNSSGVGSLNGQAWNQGALLWYAKGPATKQWRALGNAVSISNMWNCWSRQ